MKENNREKEKMYIEKIKRENYKIMREVQIRKTRNKVDERKKKGRRKERMRGKNKRPKMIMMLLKLLNKAIDDRQQQLKNISV